MYKKSVLHGFLKLNIKTQQNLQFVEYTLLVMMTTII